MEASTNIFKGGLQRDVSEPFIPADSYYDALNAVLENEYGHLSSLSNELGNLECLNLPASHRYVGSILTNTDDIVIFSTNDTVSAIGIFNPNSCKYTSVMENECLGFTTKTFVKGIFRLRKGCERIIYFTDTVNSYKIINLDDLDQYKDENGEWDCSRMSQTREVMFPKYSNITVLESGGQLEVGAYQLSLRYLDDDLNPTN